MQNYFAFDKTLIKLHQKYGKVVRIGPNMVSVGDPEAVSVIYGMNPALEKVSPSRQHVFNKASVDASRAHRTP